jgi:hypothetical protein
MLLMHKQSGLNWPARVANGYVWYYGTAKNEDARWRMYGSTHHLGESYIVAEWMPS